jgi:hypothetical protein
MAAPDDTVKALEAAKDGLTYSALCEAIQTRCGCGVRTAKSVISQAKDAGLIAVEAGIYTRKCKKCK